jgi:hypothetical protein
VKRTKKTRRPSRTDNDSQEIGTPKRCEGSGCTSALPIGRRRYCCDACQWRSNRQRQRSGDFVEIDLQVSISVKSSPEAFGVPCSRDVSDIFALDRERFCHWGLMKWPHENDG